MFESGEVLSFGTDTSFIMQIWVFEKRERDLDSLGIVFVWFELSRGGTLAAGQHPTLVWLGDRWGEVVK